KDKIFKSKPYQELEEYKELEFDIYEESDNYSSENLDNYSNEELEFKQLNNIDKLVQNIE
ncbi:10112_t:CDS:1, partial [Dentiscutata heterogama]